MTYTKRACLLASSFTIAILSSNCYATNGYASHGFGGLQKAMGGTAVAGSDNAMNAVTNPAALGFGHDGLTVGIDFFTPDRGMSHGGRQSVNGDAGIPGAELQGNGDSLFIIPEFAYGKRINAQHSWGVAVYGNGGMNATYDAPIFGANPMTSENTGIDFSQLFIAPTWAMNIGTNHTIGASINFVYQRIEITGVDGFAGFSSDASKLSDNGYDTSTGAGISLGWQGKLTPALTGGFAYRSKSSMSNFDEYAGLLAEQGDFDIPSMITAGLSFKASPAITLAIDLARINYTDVASISNKNNTGDLLNPLTAPTAPRLGDNDGAGFGWEDQDIIKLGIKYQMNNNMALLAGFNHGDAPIPDSETAFNVLAPATVEDHITLGLDWTLANNAKVIVQYMHAFENEIKGNPTPINPGQPNQGPQDPGSFIFIGPNIPQDSAAANIKMHQDSIGVSYSMSF